MGWEFSIAAGAGDLFEGLAGEVGTENRGADGVSVFEWEEGFSWRAECDQFWVPFRWEEILYPDRTQCLDWTGSNHFDAGA